MQIYEIKRGDTLWLVARRFGMTVAQVANANGFSQSSQLVVGQALVIPTPEHVYVVQPGDTLGDIALRLHTSVTDLAQYNALVDPNQISAGQVLQVPQLPKPEIETNAYLTDFGNLGQSVTADVGWLLTYLSPFSYHVTAQGGLVPLTSSGVLSAASQRRIAPLLVITNWLGQMFSSDVAHVVLNSETIQATLVENILTTLRNLGYRGLNVDFEYVYPQDREAYNRFLERLVQPLHTAGYTLSTALAPKVSADEKGLLYEAHDYPVHGRLTDFVVLMTYEWGWAGGPPWAIAPINKVRQVLDYAVTAIPKGKILMGVPVYGRDWTLPFQPGNIAHTFSPHAAVVQATTYQAEIQYHPVYQAPYYHYQDAQGQVHEVWFEDARSIQAKCDVVRDYHLRGMSYWELPSTFPENWAVLWHNFHLHKVR